MQDSNSRQAAIRLGTHGEDYGNWMSNPVFYMVGGLLALAVALAVLSFTVFRLAWRDIRYRRSHIPCCCLAGSPGSGGSMPSVGAV